MFKVINTNPFASNQECMFIGLFDQPEKFSGMLQELDENFGNELTELVKTGDISAKSKEVSVIHGLGRSGIKRLIFIGLGKEKN